MDKPKRKSSSLAQFSRTCGLSAARNGGGVSVAGSLRESGIGCGGHQNVLAGLSVRRVGSCHFEASWRSEKDQLPSVKIKTENAGLGKVARWWSLGWCSLSMVQSTCRRELRCLTAKLTRPGAHRERGCIRFLTEALPPKVSPRWFYPTKRAPLPGRWMERSSTAKPSAISVCHTSGHTHCAARVNTGCKKPGAVAV